MWPLQETAKRSDLPGWAEYGHRASHSYFWGLRLHLIGTFARPTCGLGAGGREADERQVATTLLATTPALAHRPITLIGDKNYYGHSFEAELADTRIRLQRPARAGELRVSPLRSGRSRSMP